jgi:4-amino-4-deoxy-L-arabinose transferase-like glycosyltransferase
LLALPVAALMASALRRPGDLSDNEKLLWIWLLTAIIVFSVPSQRSARYLLTAMPALAVLCALGWERLRSGWFIATLIVCAAALAFLAYESRLLQAAVGGALFPTVYWALLLGSIGFCVAAICIPAMRRPGAPVASLLLFLSMAVFLGPFDGSRGNFPAATQSAVAGREVWVPSDFTTSEEAYRFLLPTAKLRIYTKSEDLDSAALARQYRLFAVRMPLDGLPCSGCQVLGQRLDLRGRLSSADIEAILRGRVFENVFLKELLIESSLAEQP